VRNSYYVHQTHVPIALVKDKAIPPHSIDNHNKHHQQSPNMPCGCGCHNVNIDPLADESDQRVLRVLAFMKDQGFRTLLPFLTAYLNSEHHGLTCRVGRFYEKGGFRETIRLMAGHRRFGHGVKKRVTSAGTNELKAYIGEEVVDICVRIFQQELKEAAEDGYMSKKPSDVNTDNAEQFDFGECAQKIQQKAPMFSRMVRTLCCVAGERGQLYDPVPEEEQAMQEDEPLPGDDDSESEQSKQKPERRPRNKALIATMVSYGILFARSKNNNYMQVCLSIAWYQSRG
jgi:hypothetical protein